MGLQPSHAAARQAGLFWLAAVGSLFSGAIAAAYGSGAAVLASAASLLLLGTLTSSTCGCWSTRC